MTEITLKLTFEELEQIDKYLELTDSTRQLFDKIRSAYPKSPVEAAYKRVYGCYPPTTPSVSNYEDNRWSDFQKGYNASKEDCKVEEEPKPTPETLYDIVRHLLGFSIDMCDEIVDAVEEWLPDELIYDGEFADAYAYERGWNDAIRTIKYKL